MTEGESTTDSVPSSTDVVTHLESTVTDTLAKRDATAFVHVGTTRDPAVRYCSSALERQVSSAHDALGLAFDGQNWLSTVAAETAVHPAETLASRLADRHGPGTVLTPARIPHDAALYLEKGGFELASTDVVARARATKTTDEREHVAATQAAAGAGIRRAASLLADATIEDDRLVADGEQVTPRRLRRTIDEGIVAAGAFPVGNTAVNRDAGHGFARIDGDHGRTAVDGATTTDGSDTNHGTDALRPGDPIVLEATPRGPTGYYGSLTRTLVVDSDGGRERRAHVGATQSFQSAAAMLTADTESIAAVEADLEAEIRAFGFGEDDDVETRAFGVGLEPRERPQANGDEIGPGSVVRLESAVRVADGRWLRIADLLVTGRDGERAEYVSAPSRSLSPSAVLEE